jgi:hypothetical protein
VTRGPFRFGDERDDADSIPFGDPSPKSNSPRRPSGDLRGRGGSPRDVASPRDVPEGEEREQFLRYLDHVPDLMAVALDVDIDMVTAGGSIECPFRPHGECRGRVERKPRGLVYVCEFDTIERSPTDVYMTRTIGVPGRREKPTYVRWKFRLAIKVGAIRAPEVELPLLPNPTPYATAVYEGLREFVTVRRVTDTIDTAFPFTRRFAADWCGLTKEQANAGIRSVMRAGILVKVGTTPVGGHQANLYVIGTGSPDDGNRSDAERREQFSSNPDAKRNRT